MRVGGDTHDAINPALTKGSEEREPSQIGLRINRVDPEKAPIVIGSSSDSSHERIGGDVTFASSFDIDGIYPDIGKSDIREISCLDILDDIVQ